MKNLFTAPSHLSNTSKELWNTVTGRVTTPERQALLQMALECLDRLHDIRELLSRAKLTSITKKTGSLHINPLLPAEISLRSQFLDLWSRLGLSNERNETR